MTDFSNFLGAKVAPVDPKDAAFHVVPVPFERDMALGSGSALGPAAILAASQQLEPFTGHGVPSNRGIHTRPPIDCGGSVESVIESVEKEVLGALELGATPILLGGEHTVSIGAFHAIRNKFDDVGIIQFDAHADLRPTYDGSPYDRSCVMSHALELEIPFLQIGVRSISKEEAKVRNRREVWYFDGLSLAVKGLDRVFIPDDFPHNVYVTFDVDVLDSSIMPATATPEPGGLSWYDTLALLTFVADNCDVIGFDAVELAPIPGMHSPNYTVARLVHEFMGQLVND